MWPNPADLVSFIEEMLNGKLHFLCNVFHVFSVDAPARRMFRIISFHKLRLVLRISYLYYKKQVSMITFPHPESRPSKFKLNEFLTLKTDSNWFLLLIEKRFSVIILDLFNLDKNLYQHGLGILNNFKSI